MENKSWEETVAEEVREELSHSGDFLFSLPSPTDAFSKKMSKEEIEQISNGNDTIFSMPCIAPGGYETEPKTMDDQIDELEAVIFKGGALIECPLKHLFTPGLYTRTILMQEDALVTSMVHAETHQYVVSKGEALVKIKDGEWLQISAPYVGITEAGTRRVLYILSECIWTTCHATNVYPMSNKPEDIQAAVDLVEDQIFVKRENPLLGGFLKNNVVIKTIDK